MSQLTDVLSDHLPWHRARLKFMARFIGSLLKLRTVSFPELALALNPNVKEGSNYRRIQRFMADFTFDFEAFGCLLLWLLPQRDGYIVVMDRTEWHFGATPVNVLMVGIAYKGICFPVLWRVLRKSGCSNTEERKALFRRFLQLINPEKIRVFVADREFISEGWLSFLTDREIPFVIRIRKRRGVTFGAPGGPTLPAEMFFRGLQPQETKRLEDKHFVGGQRVDVLAKGLPAEADDYLILIVSEAFASRTAPIADAEQALPERALELYRRRWEIETLFGALKSRGFDLEATHVRDPERIGKLIGLLGLAFVWSHLVGEWRVREEGAPTVKKHGWPAKSLFRYGLDRLQTVMLNLAAKRAAFERCLQALIAPTKFLSCS